MTTKWDKSAFGIVGLRFVSSYKSTVNIIIVPFIVWLGFNPKLTHDLSFSCVHLYNICNKLSMYMHATRANKLTHTYTHTHTHSSAMIT